MKKQAFLAGLMLLVSPALSAGQYIVTSARITKIGSTAGNSARFWLVATDGAGPCVSQGTETKIFIVESVAASADIFKRAYANALVAVSAGKRVNIYSYTDDSCDKGVSIEILSN